MKSSKNPKSRQRPDPETDSFADSQSMQAAQKTAECKEIEARLEQVENNYSQAERLLQMTIETPDKALSAVMEGLELQGGQESQASSRSVSPAES